MKKFFVAVLVLGMASGAAFAAVPQDTASVNELNEVVVKAVQAPKNAPFALAKISRKELSEFSHTGQELPFLFARTPGVIAWSENGLGTGTTYMRIRGAADSRINVTLDGVALNSPEDQCVFWANMNSYASFLSSAQIQRGVGTSTNGDGAFGGSIALTSLAPSFDPYGEVSLSVGSYGTTNVGFNFGTGLLGNHWVFDGAFHNTSTEGYLHGTDGNSGSYYGALTYLSSDSRFKMSLKHFGNYENTGQAWNGVTAGDNDNSLIQGSNINWNNWPVTIYPTGIYTYEDMYRAGLGQFNSLYERLVPQEGVNSFADANGNYVTERYSMADGRPWRRTTDNFYQNRTMLNLTWKISDRWSTTATLHYTRGTGYYDEFRYQNKLGKFGLDRKPDAEHSFGKRSDFVRQKGLIQNTYGLVWNTNYTTKAFDLMMGVAAQNFDGNHYGYLTYISDKDVAAYYMKGRDKYQYYDSDADKNDESVFLKGTWHINDHLDLFGDVQYRHVGFHTSGNNDKFYEDENGKMQAQHLNIDKNYHFLNPKVGLSYHKGGHNTYISYALSHREPERNNFTDNGSYAAPEAESLHDIELGYSYTGKNWYAGINLYYMHYRNQFVQTGELSDIGENLTTNIKNSYRMGIEASLGYSPTKWLTLEANAAISRNRILDFDEMLSVDWEESFEQVHYDNSTLAFSPSAIVNGFATFHHKGFKAVWHTNFVSKQYLDNTESDLRSLPRYTTSAIHLSYDLKTNYRSIKNIVFGMDFNNIFNRHYAASGWVYSSKLTEAATGTPIDRYTQIGFIPMAGFTCMGNVTLKF